MGASRDPRCRGRFVSALVAALALAACSPVVVPIAPGDGPAGPQLAIQVVNASDRDVEVSYDFEAVNTGGGGEGTVASCEQALVTFGPVGGRFRVLVDGVEVHEGAAPTGLQNAWVVVRVNVDPDGEPELVGAHVTPRMPEPDSRPVAGCT